MEVNNQELEKNFITTTVDKFLNIARSNSIWPLSCGLACCSMEMMAAAAARFDLSRFGYEVFRASPRQSDLLIVAGTLTWKMAGPLKRLYDQMPEPKYVIAMGSCANSGGPFADSYSVVPGVGEILPVDVYIPGWPPRPESLIQGMLELKKKIQNPELGRKKRDE